MTAKKKAKRTSTSWTDAMNRRLKKHYPTATWEKLEKLFPGHKRGAISVQASRLGLQRKNPGQRAVKTVWTEEKEKLLRKLFPESPWPELLKAFPDQNKASITAQAYRLSLKRKDSAQKKAVQPKPVKSLRDNLIDFLSRARTDKEIASKFSKEGLAELANIAKQPPDGYRIKEGCNGFQEKTSYLQRIQFPDGHTVQPRVFEVRHSKNDRDFLAVIFPQELDFTYDQDRNALRIFPIDSSYWGDHLCDREKLLSFLEYLAAKPYAFAFLNGNNIGGTSYTKESAAEIREDFLRHLAPVAHKILWAQSGPLEQNMSRVDGVDPLQDICLELGIHHTNRPVRADIYWKQPMKPVEIYAIHGRSNARKDGAKANAIVDVMITQNFPHFTVMGHLREGIVHTHTARRLNPFEFRVKEYPAIAVICPGFQRFEGSEAEKKGYPPPAVGTVVLIINADNSHSASS